MHLNSSVLVMLLHDGILFHAALPVGCVYRFTRSNNLL